MELTTRHCFKRAFWENLGMGWDCETPNNRWTRIHLFYYCRNENDFLYNHVISRYKADGLISKICVAMSKSTKRPSQYVQDTLKHGLRLPGMMASMYVLIPMDNNLDSLGFGWWVVFLACFVQVLAGFGAAVLYQWNDAMLPHRTKFNMQLICASNLLTKSQWRLLCLSEMLWGFCLGLGVLRMLLWNLPMASTQENQPEDSIFVFFAKGLPAIFWYYVFQWYLSESTFLKKFLRSSGHDHCYTENDCAQQPNEQTKVLISKRQLTQTVESALVDDGEAKPSTAASASWLR